jgi:hypothetical protein
MPVITKRPINTTPSNVNPTNNIPQITVESTAPSVPAQTKTEVAPRNCDTCTNEFDIPLFYNPFSPLFHLLWVLIVISLIGIAFFTILNIVFFSFMGFILFILPKSQKCKKCGKIFNMRKVKDNKCPYCGAEIENDIKPH